ncbi:MAG: EamA family transporter [Proteobacteria bacterium]|nr:EamA family transporter [Pseudomonadota bacterium]
MNTASLARLLLLSAVWGASFLFMRIGAPALGPSLLIFARVGLAALFLLMIAFYLRKPLNTPRYWKHYLILGLFNSALPFLLFAYAAQTVSASLLSILNATAPIWATAIGAIWLRSRPSPKALFGTLLGMVGVSLLVGIETVTLPEGGTLAIVAGLGAAFSYGIATTYTKSAKSVEPFANAHGSMWAATLMLAPFALQAEAIPTMLPLHLILSVTALGIVCSGVAYLLYFRLIADIGAASALSVTFLIPVFGILWGTVFLGEHVGWHTLVGSLIILTGTALVTSFSISTVLLRRVRHAA